MALLDVFGKVHFVLDFTDGERSFLGTLDNVVVRASKLLAIHRTLTDDNADFRGFVKAHLN